MDEQKKTKKKRERECRGVEEQINHIRMEGKKQAFNMLKVFYFFSLLGRGCDVNRID